MNMKRLILMFVAVATFVSCCKKQPSLENTSWELIEINGVSVDRGSLDDSESYTLNFDKEVAIIKATGKGDANRFFANCEFEGICELEFENMGSTRMMSPNQQMEDVYFKMLDDVESYTVKENTLILKDDGKVISKFVRK